MLRRCRQEPVRFGHNVEVFSNCTYSWLPPRQIMPIRPWHTFPTLPKQADVFMP